MRISSLSLTRTTYRFNLQFISFFVAFLLIALSGTLSSSHGQWPKYWIDEHLRGAMVSYTADMDGDNDLDVVSSGYRADNVLWYEAPSWNKHNIDSLISAADIYVADMDADNDSDVVATRYVGGIFCYEAPSWNKHVIDGNMNGAQNVFVADLDGDNDRDVVATGRESDDVVWYEAPSWTKHVIDENLDGARHVYVADMDRDNDLDVVVSGFSANDVVWYKNTISVGVAK